MTKLYLRLWLAVVAAIAVLSFLFAWATRAHMEQRVEQRVAEQVAQSAGREPAFRELTLRDEQGQTLGKMQSRPTRVPGRGVEYAIAMQDGKTIFVQIGPRLNADGSPVPPRAPGDMGLAGSDRFPLRGRAPGAGMDGGPGQPGAMSAPLFFRQPVGLLVLLGLISLGVALGAYPVVRRLTQRLDALKKGVETFGNGQLTTRVEVKGHDEIAFLARQFNESAARIERLVSSHKTLLANASHELRSPLTRIRMGLELAQSSPSAALQTEMRRSVEELDQLIDEILLASRLDANEADMGSAQELDWLGLVAEECARAGIELDVSASSLEAGNASHALQANVHGVAKLLRRLVRNLLENALRYGGSDVQAKLLIGGQTALLQVTDSGPGVPKDQRERIFEPFYRLPGASESSGGVGLGLALVRSIALKHGGAVQCMARPGGVQGACFEVSLPLVAG